MATNEIIPPTREKRHFPIGDVVDSHRDQKVDTWFNNIQSMTKEQYFTTVKYNCTPTQMDGENASKTHLAAIALCDTWDQVSDTQFTYVHLGYRLAMTFNQNTRYLPACDMDLSEDLTQMRQPESEGGRLYSARHFGGTAWKSMEAYPRVHKTFERLHGFAVPIYELGTDEIRDDFRTGLSLPFMFAWASRLHGYGRYMPSSLRKDGTVY